jgi:hypothetical protein
MIGNVSEFFQYIRPIVYGCSGFIKTDGYMLHQPGSITVMDAGEMYCGIIKVPILYPFTIVSKINTFLSFKDSESIDLNNLYFLGSNIKMQHLMNYYNQYNDIDTKVRCIYSEPDCYNIDRFQDTNSTADIKYVNISDGIRCYRIPSSKAITTATKSDTVSLFIYDYIFDPSNESVKTARYSIYKKKFKLTVDIFSNIMVL